MDFFMVTTAHNTKKRIRACLGRLLCDLDIIFVQQDLFNRIRTRSSVTDPIIRECIYGIRGPSVAKQNFELVAGVKK